MGRRAFALALGTLLLGGCRQTMYAGIQEQLGDTYLDTAAYETAFLAVGTHGRLDLVHTDGTVEALETGTGQALLDVAVQGDSALAVGTGGTAVLLEAGESLRLSQTGREAPLTSCVGFQGLWLAGTEQGLLYTSDLEAWSPAELALEGTVTGLAATDKRCVGVTDAGETFTSTDGRTWSVLDYAGYYQEPISFWGIETCGNAFYAFGQDEEGTSRVVTTVEGGVWSDRGPLATDGAPDPLVTALCWDGQQAIASCWGGEALTLPACTECNKAQRVSESGLSGIACNGGKILLVGEDYSLFWLDTEQARQHNIKPAAALALQQAGAQIIDVRSAEDYARRHIAGSIHIPVADISQQLPQLFPDRTQPLVFYCLSGTRSQTALETALELGYEEVYNLGRMDAWPYAFEGTEAQA